MCPDSWAMVKARPSPVSSLIVQLRYLLHIPLIGAKPAIRVIFTLQQDTSKTHHNLKKKNQSCSASVTGCVGLTYQTELLWKHETLSDPPLTLIPNMIWFHFCFPYFFNELLYFRVSGPATQTLHLALSFIL